MSAQPRDNSITFLRLVLATLVLYTHAHLLGGFRIESFNRWTGNSLILGTVGVQGFFVLSGALITASWIRRASLGRFLWCRLLRLGPALWTCLLVTALLLTPLFYLATSKAHPSFFSLDPPPLRYVWRNLFQPRAQIGIGPFPDSIPWAGDWNGSLWTLFYEGACYLMIAVLGVAGLLGRARTLGIILLAGIVAAFSVQALPGCIACFPAIATRLFDTPGKQLSMYFFAGALWAMLPNQTACLLRSRWIGPAACALMIASWHWGFHRWLGPWVMPMALFWLAARLPLVRFEDAIGGDYSYGLYLYAYPIEQTLARFGIASAGFWPFLGSSFLAAGLCAVASWHGIEKPALALKSLFARAPRSSAP